MRIAFTLQQVRCVSTCFVAEGRQRQPAGIFDEENAGIAHPKGSMDLDVTSSIKPTFASAPAQDAAPTASAVTTPSDQGDRKQAALNQGVPGDQSKRLLPWLVAVALFMESLDTTILNTAVPAISAALKVGPLSMKSVLASYTLSLAVFIPISGWMADRFWNAQGVCRCNRGFYAGFAAVRNFERHSSAGRLPGLARGLAGP